MVPAREHEQALGLVCGLVQLLADGVGDLLVAAGVEQEQRRVRSEPAHRLVDVE